MKHILQIILKILLFILIVTFGAIVTCGGNIIITEVSGSGGVFRFFDGLGEYGFTIWGIEIVAIIILAIRGFLYPGKSKELGIFFLAFFLIILVVSIIGRFI